jgi:hypothetical protein
MYQKPVIGKEEETIRTLPFRAGVIMLLFFYLATFVYSPAGGPHVHHEDELHHTDSCAKDACHLAIYHPGSEGGCNHKYHFTQADEECGFCHLLLPRQILALETESTSLTNDFSFFIPGYCGQKWISLHFPHADRGPPYLI